MSDQSIEGNTPPPANKVATRAKPVPPVGQRWKPGVSGNPSGRPKSRPFKEAIEKALKEAGEHGPSLLKIAQALLIKAESGDIPAIRELRDTLDGRPIATLEHSGPEGRPPLTRIVHEFVHLEPRPQLEQQREKPLDVEYTPVDGQAQANGDERELP